MAEAEPEDDKSRRKKRGILKLYYGISDQSTPGEDQDPHDINGAHFQYQSYLEKLFKEKALPELMDKETEIVKQIKSLDSDMQTLVYENYNKFISATDTIKKMKNDFHKMEDEMRKLDSTLSKVMEFSDDVSSAFQEKREQISKLSGIHILLQKLQFLFELPSRLNKCMDMGQYSIAVRYYIKARDVLHRYKDMPSFKGIHSDCEAIVVELTKKLKEQLRNPKSTTRQLTESVNLLLRLNEPAAALCEEFLSLAKDKVECSIDSLQKQVTFRENEVRGIESEEDSQGTGATDILDFIDQGCNGFLSDITLVIASYNELFFIRQSKDNSEQQNITDVAKEKLNIFIMGHMNQYFKLIKRRIELEVQTEDSMILVRALDKFNRKIETIHQLLPDQGIGRTSANIVALAAHNRVKQYSDYLSEKLAGIITDMRQALVSSRVVGLDKKQTLADIMATALADLVDQMKSVLQNLKAFIHMDITFSSKPYFRGPFCIDDVRESLVVSFLRTVLEKAKNFGCEQSGSMPVPQSLLIIMSRLCLDLSEKTIRHLITVTEEWFPVDEDIKQGCVVTSIAGLCEDFKNTSQELLNFYVKAQGVSVSQMIRKSVETRDWLNTIEPRTVRAVMKRVVEDISTMDSQVGNLFEEGTRKAHSSDSSKWTQGMNRAAAKQQLGYNSGMSVDASLMSNIQKLFSEKIEIFTSVEFNKVSVLTGIIKIALKTLLECVRLRTFSKYGLQQIQVDTHYLQLYLWRFVTDENLAHFMLDEVVNSTIHRCLEPELMEPSVIEIICERN
ncbi:vacuolar protein sorting-associated protein 51 homolog [Rhopilema esculentum]|uniref:vacuolar protein sorting-associated protein 51 homolog n=1 Tax=Rhopilema esculentum TaxID=499914 RepID=UPI0031D0805C